MEILAHTLWTTAGVKKINNNLEQKHSRTKISMFWASFWGIFPDLFAFTIPFLVMLYNTITKGGQAFYMSTKISGDGINLAHTLYQYSHSIIIWALVFIILWAILKRPYWEICGWALHILLDIPSHSLDFFPTPFLFPVSNYHFPYGVAWRTPWFMIVNYMAIFVVWGSILFKRIYIKK